MIRISKQYDSAFKLKKGVVYIAPLCDEKKHPYINNYEEWYTITIEEYTDVEVMELYNELKILFNDCEFIFSNYSVQYYSLKRKLFKQWMQSDNVIKLGNKYTFQCIQYKKQFTFAAAYKYWLKEYHYI
tara:strand:+ start:732 stop:1118 length:387 start_codon:yes stop_codon:yes gene_type:complete